MASKIEKIKAQYLTKTGLINYRVIKHNFTDMNIKLNKEINVWCKEQGLPYYDEIPKFSIYCLPIGIINCDPCYYICKKENNTIYFITASSEIVIGKIIYNNDETTQIVNFMGKASTHKPIQRALVQFSYYYEWIYNYIDKYKIQMRATTRLSSILSTLKTAPKGFQNYFEKKCEEILNNGDEITMNFFIEKLSDYVFQERIKNYTKTQAKFLQFYREEYGKDNVEIEYLLQKPTMIDIIYPLIKNSAKELDIDGIVWTIKDIVKKCIEDSNIEDLLNINRTLNQNIEIITEYKNAKRNQLISIEQNKIIPFDNKKISAEYISIVPKDVNDLIKEGEMQNNCVGSFYNDDIANGYTKIIFIRKKSAPEKSFITCQVAENGRIVQARTKNNGITLFNQRKIVNKLSEDLQKYYTEMNLIPQ